MGVCWVEEGEGGEAGGEGEVWGVVFVVVVFGGGWGWGEVDELSGGEPVDCYGEGADLGG